MLSVKRRPALTNVHSIDPALLHDDKIQPDHPLFGLVWINPKRVSGAPCFFGTRVPLQNLFDSIAAGEVLDEFLDGFEGVSREQALEVLRLAAEGLLSDLKNI